MRIEKNTFLVTGGSSGLGKETVEDLLKRGANVVIADTAPTQETHNGKTIFAQTDVTNPESIERAVSLAFDTFGSLNGVVNCAGVGTIVKTVAKKRFGALDAARRVIEINLLGTYNVLSIAASRMAEQEPTPDGERGVFINTASVAAFDGQVGQAPYSASKGGIASMTLPLAREMAAYGFRVVAIAPGVFDTPMMARLPAKSRDALVESIPFPRRLGMPIEFASLVAHTIENVYINGDIIRLDGSVRMP